jgi:polyhydroxyalkanoate synthesis regulator phasin
MKRLLSIAAVVAVLGVTAVVVGGAVTSAQEGDGPIGTFLEKLAGKLGIGEDELKTAIEETQSEMIDEAVADGRLTEEQAERLRERLGEGGFPFGSPLSRMTRHVGPHFYVTEAAVEVLDTTRDELSQQLRDGNSLAEVAEAQGMSAEDFQAALLLEVKAQLDDLVAEGKLTQEHADLIFQAAEENIDSIVSGQLGPRGPGGRRLAPCGFGGWWFGAPADEPAESTEASGVTA